jgi:putative transcriptional regulator
MGIEFDPAKDARNIAVHGVSLADMEQLLSGFTVEFEDGRFNYGETRIIALGEINGRVFVCVYTMRGTIYRPISLRAATGRNVMSTTRRKAAKPHHDPDWAAIDRLTDAEIAAQIAANPDAAPDVSDWPIDKAVISEPVDVKAIRAKLGMSQDAFAATFGFSAAALRDWEQRRRVPRGPARALLQIIEREPEAARRALVD